MKSGGDGVSAAGKCVKEILGRDVSKDDHVGVAPNGNVVIWNQAGDTTKTTIVTPEGDVNDLSTTTKWETRLDSLGFVHYVPGPRFTNYSNNYGGVYDPKKVDQARECIVKAEKK